jgi:hypothetical protein
MNARHRPPAALAALALLAGCASSPMQTHAAREGATPSFPQAASIGPGMSCAQLLEAARQAHDAREKATEHQRSSWQVVFPIAVAVRYASAASDISSATAALEKASSTAAAKDCPAAANG